MILQVLFACIFTTLLVRGQRFSKSIQVQPRQGYSTTVVHSHPDSNDLHSESSVNVDFQPQQEVAFKRNTRTGTLKYLQPNSNVEGNNFYTHSSFDNIPKSTNSFNVGYNISFSGSDGAKSRKQLNTRVHNKKLENAEVITGKSKKNEKVRAPGIRTDLSPEDFVSHAFLKQKQMNSESLRHTSSPTQGSATLVKYLNPVREYASKLQSQSPKFTYNTQQNIFRDVIKATKPDAIQLGQEFKTSYQTNGRWNSAGPGLEISKSIEHQVPENFGNSFNPRYTNSKAPRSQQPQIFNHDSALKNSLAFDFSNAHGKMIYDVNDSVNDNNYDGSEQYIQKTSNHDQSQNENFNNPQLSDLNNINIEAHVPIRFKGIKPLPIDTSLLKDAVLTTDFREAPKDARVIPIRFDISRIQTVMKEQLAQIQNHAANRNPYLSVHLPNPSHAAGLSYEDHEQSASKNDYLRIYGKPESVDTDRYRMGYKNDYEGKKSNFDNDVYKIVSMRPPPVRQNLKY